jgi:hypothetical protein
VGIAKDNLAKVYAATNRRKEADTLLREALKIKEKTLGPNHSYVGMTLDHIASNLLAMISDTQNQNERVHSHSLSISHIQIRSFTHFLIIIDKLFCFLDIRKPCLKNAKHSMRELLPSSKQHMVTNILHLVSLTTIWDSFTSNKMYFFLSFHNFLIISFKTNQKF